MIERVSVVGLGKLGACLAACIADRGYTAIGVDTSHRSVDLINQGVAPVTEPGLAELVAANRGRLRATQDYLAAIMESDLTFVVVPTPSEDGGRFTLRYVNQAIQEIGRALAAKADYHLVVVTSTVLPGSMQAAILPLLESSSGKRCGKDIGLCYNPEFIALGSVIRDLRNADFLLIGESDPKAGDELEGWYRGFIRNTPPVRRMNFVNAELAKIAVNTFVTTKITFANMLAGICEQLPDADVDTVTQALGMDSRIGSRYLTGAVGYGGPCFPRDNQALGFLARELGCPAGLAEATDRENRAIIERRLQETCQVVDFGKRVAVLGLAYKPDTTVVEESQGIALAQGLAAAGRRVIVFDPLAIDNARLVLGESVEYASSLKGSIQETDAVLIVNPCREFRELGPEDFPRREMPIPVFDYWRILSDRLVPSDHIEYIAIGRGRREPGKQARLATMWTSEAADGQANAGGRIKARSV